jgi:hypothetical protein
MKHYGLYLRIIVAAGVTIACGILNGRLTHRWGPSTDMRSAAERLDAIPDHFGSWRLHHSEKMGQTVIDMLQCAGYVFRTYVDTCTGEQVRVAILLGPPGPIAVHTPEICFSSRDYHQEALRRRVAVPGAEGGDDAFWAVTFRANDLQRQSLRIYYGWTTGGKWEAAESPRYGFAGSPYLYKIQLATFVPSWARTETQDPCRRFLADFLPSARNCLLESHVSGGD